MDILRRLQSHFKKTPFSQNDVRHLGISQAQFKLLLGEEQVLRLSRGVYVFPDFDLNDEAQFRAATIRIRGPSAVCLLSALAYYGLTDQIPKRVWLLVPENKHTAHRDIRLLRSRNPHWKIGIVAQSGYRITNVERTIVDALTMKRVLGTSVSIDALKTGLKTKKTTVAKVLDMATSLGVDHRIMSYLEATS